MKQFGVAATDELVLPAYTEAAELEHFKINAGDKQGVLTGKRLDEVKGFELKGIRLSPRNYPAPIRKTSFNWPLRPLNRRPLFFRPMNSWLRMSI